MAASTSTAALSNKNSRYDVFISDRGPDVQKTFASHLYRRLISYGLQVFIDYQELQQGEDFPGQIKGAIRTASLHVAIFSPTYADSPWCLDKLVLMLKSGAPIIPVFHHVEPTELRRTQGEGTYARSLRNLQQKRKSDSDQPRHDSKAIENWRNALSWVADISGLDLDAFNGDEGELVDKVVEGVKTLLNGARFPIGLDTRVEDFEKTVLLRQQSGKVQVVGITGFGGVGKTTLAEEVFNRKKSNYNKSYFLFDIRENAKKSLHSLQSKLLKGLLQRDMYIDNKDEGIEMLRKHLSSSQVLLVLDDVDDVEQVHALLPLDVLHHDSLILITSRDKDILARSGVPEASIYKLTGLNTERSRELFCCHAFCQPRPLPGFEDLVNQFLRACDGLPLSLKVFGGLLYGKTDRSYWEDELDELGKTLPYEIQKRLQISYDALQTEEKQIFLEIACFFRGMDRDTAIRVWEASGWNGSLGFRSLLNKCLVEEDLDLQTMKHSIRMHGHLRDLGRELAKSSGFLCRLWRATKYFDYLLQQSSEATEVRGIRMLPYDERAYSDDEDDERASFSRYKMKNLQLLDMDMEEEDTLKCLLKGVDSPKLLWFRWLNCPSSSLPPYIPMEELRVLEVRGNKLQTLWQEDLQAPSQLRELLIHTVHGLSKILKSIGQLKHLERMEVTSSSDSIVEIPKEFCDLHSLKHLVLHVTNLSSLPDSFGNLSTLEHINLSACGHWELPDSFGNLSMLEHIDLSGCGHLERLPDSFGNLSMLQRIDLSGCGHLERLPESFGNLSKLKHINLSACGHWEFPDSFWNLSMLEHIDLSRCGHLERLPDSFGNLSRLKHIDMSYCHGLQRLPDSFGNLSMLEHIDMSYCHGLQRLPDSFWNLSRLERIYLSDSGHLQRLPDSFGNLSRLEHIDMSYCRNLERLSDSFGNLSRLEHIDMSYCRNLERLPDSFGSLSRLEHINLSHCEHLQRLPDSFGNLSKLEHIDMFYCGNLERLPDSFGNLSRLEHIDMSYCGKLERLPDSFGSLSRLQHINLSHCDHLQRLPDSFGSLSRLQHINLSHCEHLQRLPDSFRNLSRLQHINLSYCGIPYCFRTLCLTAM